MSNKKEKLQEPFEIGGVKIEPGKTKIVHIPISTMSPHFAFDIDIRVVHGRYPGKCLFLSSTIHGDELNGIETVRRVLNSPHIKLMRGTLIAIPVVNLIGVLIRSRYLADRRDLNRSFPGSEKGSAASQLAHTFLTEIVKRCTHGIDLHTGSDNRINLPQIRCDFRGKKSMEMAKAFGAPVILKSRLRDGSLREASEAMGIPTILFEGGEALRFNEFAIRAAVQGVFRVMGLLGMVPLDKCVSLTKTPVISESSDWLRAPETGIFRTTRNLGDEVLKGEVVGKVTDSLGLKTVDVVATFDGIIVGRTQLPLVYKGDALFNVAHVFDPRKAQTEIREVKEEVELNPALDDPTTF